MDFLLRKESGVMKESNHTLGQRGLTIPGRYGGPAPRLNGSIALDLHRMNKIIDVDGKNAYAVVEPGVTFTDLYQYCVKHELGVWPSVPSLGWGSVVGNVILPYLLLRA